MTEYMKKVVTAWEADKAKAKKYKSFKLSTQVNDEILSLHSELAPIFPVDYQEGTEELAIFIYGFQKGILR